MGFKYKRVTKEEAEEVNAREVAMIESFVNQDRVMRSVLNSIMNHMASDVKRFMEDFCNYCAKTQKDGGRTEVSTNAMRTVAVAYAVIIQNNFHHLRDGIEMVFESIRDGAEHGSEAKTKH